MSKNEKSTTPKWTDPDDAPRLTRELATQGEVRDGDEVVRPASGTLTGRGRPRLDAPKKLVTLRLDQSVIEKLRASGPGWQSRANAILKKAVDA
jgi:uncharacterized protein (DUF4415 family)